MNALVVGAGAVGQVFACHLHRAGSSVTFLARGKRAHGLQSGLVLYALNRRHARRQPIHFSSFEVLTDPTQLARQAWDQIYMCVPSTALRDGLLERLKDHVGDATIVKLQPGLGDRAAYRSHIGEAQLVAGMASLVSYRAPLRGETVPEPGTAYWFPPLLPCLFGGADERAQRVVETLRAGGFPAKRHRDVEALLAYVLAVEAPLTAGLECAEWSLQRFQRSRWFAVACQAAREACEVVSQSRGSTAPRLLRLLRCWTLRLAVALLPKRRPVPLESYLEYHFTKLRAQSRQHLDDYIAEGRRRNLAIESIVELRQCLGHGESPAIR